MTKKLSLREKAQQKIKTGEQVGYNFYGLSRNPFPKIASAPPKPEFIVFPEKDLERIENSIAGSFINNEFGGTVIIGEYGSGKTHTLRYVESKINEELVEVNKESAIAIYAENPHSSLSELVSSLMESFGKANIIEMIKKKFKKTSNEPERRRKMKEIVGDLDTAGLLLQAALEEDEEAEYAWEALMGKSRRGYRKRVDIRPEKFVHSFLALLHKLSNYKHIYLLIDEFEDIPGSAQTKTKKREFLDALRSLIDNNLIGFSLIVASAKDPWEKVKEMLPPFVNRFNLTIPIFGLSDNEVIEFIKEYLKTIGKSSKNNVYPFTEGALKKINQEENGVKRFVIQRCHDLIEEGIRNKIRKIDVDTISIVSPKNFDYQDKLR